MRFNIFFVLFSKSSLFFDFLFRKIDIMNLSNVIKVPMYKEKITCKKSEGDTIYVYYTLRSYRRKSDNGPTSDEVSIGKKDL